MAVAIARPPLTPVLKCLLVASKITPRYISNNQDVMWRPRCPVSGKSTPTRTRVSGVRANTESAGMYEPIKSVSVPTNIGDTTPARFPMVRTAAVTMPTLLALTPGSSIGIVKAATIKILNMAPSPIIQTIMKI